MDKDAWDKLTDIERDEILMRYKFNLDYIEYIDKLIDKYDENTGQ